MNTKIRKATISDLDGIMAVIEEARGTIAALGIDQWQDGYPQREIIEADIRSGVSFCIENTDTGEILSTFAVFEDGEVLYDRIFYGAWKTGYRVCAKFEFRSLQEKRLLYRHTPRGYFRKGERKRAFRSNYKLCKGACDREKEKVTPYRYPRGQRGYEKNA